MAKDNLKSVLDKLAARLKKRPILLGVGNTLRGDDGFGSALARKIRNNISLRVLEAEDAPENFLGIVIEENPAAILFIDAVDFKGEAGELRLWDLKRIKTKNFFLTHNPSPRMLCDFLKANTQAEIYLLAIQPQDIGLREEMTPKIKSRLEELAAWFLERYPKKREQWKKR